MSFMRCPYCDVRIEDLVAEPEEFKDLGAVFVGHLRVDHSEVVPARSFVNGQTTHSVNWNNSHIQFPRLLSEVETFLTDINLMQLGESMDLSRDELLSLFARADLVWEAIKDMT